MNFLRSTWHLLGINMRTAALFELAFRLAFGAILVPLCLGMLDLAMSAANLPYLMDANLAAFATHPLTWVLVILAVLVLGLCALIEMCALVILMQAGRENRRLGVFELIRHALAQAKRIAQPRNWLLVPFVLLLVPITNIALASSAISEIHLPEFIEDFIMNDTFLTCVLIALIVVLYIHAFNLAFSIHFFTLCDLPWMRARTASYNLLRKNRWLLLRRLLAIALLLALISIAVSLAGDAIIAFIAANNPNIGALLVIGLLGVAFLIVYSCLLLPLAYAALSCTFYELADKKDILVPYGFDDGKHAKHRSRLVGALATTGLVALAALSLFAYAAESGMFEPQPAPPSDFTVSAHRGGSFEAPENTMAAFANAIEQDADWIELDVQQTSDGVLIIMHDSNLKRTTGVDKNIWETTYAEIAGLDNGSWFSPEYADEGVPTLDEVLAFCKGKIKLNIEVKPDGHGVDLEKKTVDMVNAYDMKDEVAIASISYESLRTVKHLDPSMRTLFNMTLAYGRISEIEDVDIFSVDEFFVTQEMVNEVRAAGKIIFAWTVNDPSNMARLVEYGIDGLVTDDIQTAKQAAVAYGEPVEL